MIDKILNNPLKTLGSVIAFIVAMVLVFGSFYINNEFERAVVTRMGEYHTTTEPGLHWKIPIVDTVYTADTRMQQLVYPNLQVATRDGQVIGVTLTVNHRIHPNNMAQIPVLFEQFGGQFNYDATFLRNMSQDRAKSVIGRYTMEDFMPNRDMIRTQAYQEIVESAERYGIVIEDVQISDVQFSPQYRSRLEDVARARAEASQAQQEARREEYRANAAIEQARGQAESRRLNANAEAYARLEMAQSEAESIRLEGEAKADAMRIQAEVLQNATGLIEYTRAQSMLNWDGTVPRFMSGGEGGQQIFPFMQLTDRD